MNLNERDVAEKLRDAEVTLSREWGDFTLIGLFEQEDKPGKWDLVASAPWLMSNRASIQKIVDGLESYFKSQDWSMVSHTVPLRPEEPFVQTMLRLLRPVEHDVWETGPLFTADYRVSRAVIITARPSPVPHGQTREAALAL